MRHVAATLLCVLFTACTATPKTWIPNRYSPPPGVTQTVWEECWKKEEANARKKMGNRYESLTPKQKRCLVMRLTNVCVEDAIALLERAAPEIAARCDVDTFEEFMVDAEYEQCGDHEGGANEVLEIFLYLSGERRGQGGGALNRNACPAN